MNQHDLIQAAKAGEAVMVIVSVLAAWFGWIRWGWPKFKAGWDALSGLLDMGAQAATMLGSIARIAAVESSIHRVEGEVAMMVGQMRAHADADDGTARLDCNAAGEVEWASRALMTWTRRTAGELLGAGWISSIHPEDREDVAEEWGRCIRHRRQFDGIFRVVDRDGISVGVRMAGMPITTREGRSMEVLRWAVTLRREERRPDGLAVPERMPQSRNT